MTDHPDVDARLRAAWADLRHEDHQHPPAPPGLWDDIHQAVATTGDLEQPGPADPPHRRRRGRLAIAVAVAAGLVVAVGVASVVRQGSSETLRAEAELTTEGLDTTPGPTGTALLVDDGGRNRLDVDIAGIDDRGDDSVLEVWLIDPETGGLQSLGLLDGSSNFPVPSSVDVTRFSTVDISREPTDGDPTHSGDSLLRGSLEPT